MHFATSSLRVIRNLGLLISPLSHLDHVLGFPVVPVAAAYFHATVLHGEQVYFLVDLGEGLLKNLNENDLPCVRNSHDGPELVPTSIAVITKGL